MNRKFPGDFPDIIKFNGEPLTKEDLHFLHKKGEKLSLYSIAFIFGVEPELVFLHMWRHKILTRKEEYPVQSELEEKIRQEKEKMYEEKRRKYEFEEEKKRSEIWKQAEELYGKPKPKVRYFKVNGKTFADRDELNHYNREVRAIYNQLLRPKPKNVNPYNEVRNVDLSAMRLHRGLDMFKFSQVSKIPYKHVIYYEKTKGVHVPKEISNVYFDVLNISRSEFKKIKDVLSGKRKDMHDEETRIIPDAVRKYVWERDGGKCKKCGRTEHLHFHHKQHYSLGGKHKAGNLVLLCIGCHALEHEGEKGYGMLKARAEKLGVIV